MCYALFGVRGPACESKWPSRENDSEKTPTGGPVRFVRGNFGRGRAGRTATPLIADAAMNVIDIGEITYPFIACATGIALPVAMKAAANRPAQGA
jgi:hypothetical protein